MLRSMQRYGSRATCAQSIQACTNGIGTPLYFSPELCQDRPYDCKSDVWAAGCLMYELACFRPPFIASNQIALAQYVIDC